MIILVIGNVGSGKTLLLTILSQISKRNVFANYNIKDSNKKVLPFKIKDVLDEKINNSDIYLDEFYLYMDSRHFMNDINNLLSYFAFQSRKLKLRIFLSTQLIRTIDVRMREMINHVIECSYVAGSGFYYTIYTDVNKPDMYSAPKELFLSDKNAKKYFNRYDTYQIISTPQFETIKRNVAITEYTDKEKLKIAKDCINFLKQNKLKLNKTNTSIFCRYADFSTKKSFIDELYSKAVVYDATNK